MSWLTKFMNQRQPMNNGMATSNQFTDIGASPTYTATQQPGTQGSMTNALQGNNTGMPQMQGGFMQNAIQQYLPQAVQQQAPQMSEEEMNHAKLRDWLSQMLGIEL